MYFLKFLRISQQVASSMSPESPGCCARENTIPIFMLRLVTPPWKGEHKDKRLNKNAFSGQGFSIQVAYKQGSMTPFLFAYWCRLTLQSGGKFRLHGQAQLTLWDVQHTEPLYQRIRIFLKNSNLKINRLCWLTWCEQCMLEVRNKEIRTLETQRDFLQPKFNIIYLTTTSKALG